MTECGRGAINRSSPGDMTPEVSTTVDGDIFAIALVGQTVLYVTSRTTGVGRWAP